MSTSEFDIIRQFFAAQRADPEVVPIGIGDDAAVINTRADEQLLISIDTLNSGVHFPQQTEAYDIGYKALAVNLSDIAAMGGQPCWFTLALSLAEVDRDWLSEFSRGLLSLAAQYQLSLAGGDTTRGPLSITIQIAGTVPMNKYLQRRGACIDDDIYVTGSLGDAAAALVLSRETSDIDTHALAYLMQRLNRPQPRVAIGMALRGIASSCIDISDGLAADLGHILQASRVGAEIHLSDLPRSSAMRSIFTKEERMQECMLYGGDDYELCFTAPVESREDIAAIARQHQCAITRIGRILAQSGLYYRDAAGRHPISPRGYDHFTSS